MPRNKERCSFFYISSYLYLLRASKKKWHSSKKSVGFDTFRQKPTFAREILHGWHDCIKAMRIFALNWDLRVKDHLTTLALIMHKYAVVHLYFSSIEKRKWDKKQLFEIQFCRDRLQ